MKNLATKTKSNIRSLLMKGHINLNVTHKLLYRLYLKFAVIAIVSGLGILSAPMLFAGSDSYDVINAVLPLYLSGALFTLSGIGIALSLWRMHYKIARTGISVLAVLYFMWGTGILTNNILNLGTPTALFAVLSYWSLSMSAFYMLLEPPINPETAIEIKNKKVYSDNGDNTI